MLVLYRPAKEMENMQKYMMFSDMKAKQIMYPNGAIKTRDEVIADYPILGTPLGVVGIRCEDNGVVEDLALMESYNNLYAIVDAYKAQGVVFPDGISNAEKCEIITTFVNSPKTSE